MAADDTNTLDAVSIFSACNLLLGIFCSRQAWIRSWQTTLDEITILGLHLIHMFVLYACFSTSISYVLFIKGVFLAPLTIQLFSVPTSARNHESRMWEFLLYLRSSLANRSVESWAAGNWGSRCTARCWQDRQYPYRVWRSRPGRWPSTVLPGDTSPPAATLLQHKTDKFQQIYTSKSESRHISKFA